MSALKNFCFLAAMLGLLHAGALDRPAARADEPVDFSRDVRPILSKKCFKCHGPDDGQRQAGLRLDLRDAALGESESGAHAIVPNQPEASELVRRILSTDENEQMPPPSAKLTLTEQECDTLRRWIAEGAEYRPHWSFQSPTRPPLPNVRQTQWPRSPIDYFTLARMEAAGLAPSPQADRLTLARRVYLDLIGLPPTPAEADAFVNDPSPDAYEKLVDRLLASPHYGERFARRWLDLARYADTNGYEKDRQRSIWPYRDWVIGALNRDLPFDQFTVEQLAGDMLPGASLDQRVATGFHRNTMTNEEGGIDPLEFRFYSMTDRVNTTATVWLGLTLGCAQCHTHKYDPLTQREYYQFMAFLNNADELTTPAPGPKDQARADELTRQIAALEADLANQFPPEGEMRWHDARAISLTAESKAQAELLGDGSFRVSGETADKDNYTIVIECDASKVSALRVEALADAALPSSGPGRTAHGNFVLTEISAAVAPLGERAASPTNVRFSTADAEFSQDGFPPANALDGQANTGWAIHGPGKWNVDRAATFTFEKPMETSGPSRWTIRLEQQYGGQHTLGRVRIRLGERIEDDRPLAVRRAANLAQRYAAWETAAAAKAARWRVLPPSEWKANLARMEVLDDGSVFASGDLTKRDVYELKYPTGDQPITALRLEVLPDDRLPERGPGRVFYEGPFGDFFLSEMSVATPEGPVSFPSVSQSFASGESKAEKAVDHDPLTGWSIDGGQGRAHQAVFRLAQPLTTKELSLEFVFERYYAASLGRFRLSATSDARPLEASSLPADVEEILLIPAPERTADQSNRLMQQFLATAPELAAQREEIAQLRKELRQTPTTLVFQERPANHPRPTYIHKRGEFLQPTDPVEPRTLAALHPMAPDATPNRLAFAKWLVDPRNPLVGRVTVNRQWAAFFGRGLVRTTEDFGFQGELPTHPELLDWLAIEFTGEIPENADPDPSAHSAAFWSMKRLHRLLVTSATYQQSSHVTPELAARDPENKLLARGPRFRVEAELVRDAALAMSGLLSEKLGGKSVFPTQPTAVTTDGAYGGLAWTVSPGGDRFRRGLYTFSKRTAPFAMFTTFDAPSGEACTPRRELSNTPLQALTLLNDQSFLEAAQALGADAANDASSLDRDAVVTRLFRRCLVRPPSSDELKLIGEFFAVQRKRFEAKELDPAAIAGPGDGDLLDRAAWTVTARALLNLDETFAKD